ncbi:MAG: putative 2-oxoglutarate:ferredoxin oxidoreductase, beta subunit [Pseudomonadota bacterium]|jgi:CBS domain-containing protein
MDQKTLMSTLHSATARGIQLIPPNILSESIGSIGLKDPLTVAPTTTLQDCLHTMQKHRVGSLLVTDENDKLVGIFTERDFLLKVIGKISDLGDRSVGEFMTKDPVRERPDASLAFALSVMSHGGFRHVPIVDQDDVPIGIVSVKDVVDHFVRRMLDGIFASVDTVL